MHRAIAGWLTEHPWRAVAASAALGALLPPMFPFAVIPGAITILLGLQRDPRWAMTAAAAGSIATLMVMTSLEQPLALKFSVIAVTFVAPALFGVLLRSIGSLTLCFQVAVLLIGLSLIIVHLAIADPVGLWVPQIRSALDSLMTAGIEIRSDSETLTADLAKDMWGLLAAVILTTILCAVCLGRWWQSLLIAPGAFGREYQQLRVGAVLGAAAGALLLWSLVGQGNLLSALVWLAFTALSFQGLAAAHRAKARGTLNRGWLAAIYVLLIVANVVTVLVLAAWGFADNWKRARPQRA